MQLSHKIRPFVFMTTINHQTETIQGLVMWNLLWPTMTIKVIHIIFTTSQNSECLRCLIHANGQNYRWRIVHKLLESKTGDNLQWSLVIPRSVRWWGKTSFACCELSTQTFVDSWNYMQQWLYDHILRKMSTLADKRLHKKLITRWDSKRELFYDDIVHALQNNNIYGSIAEVCYHAKIHC